eukprot:scaffold2501_cov113-Isochrysis_galbana.AAC.3
MFRQGLAGPWGADSLAARPNASASLAPGHRQDSETGAHNAQTGGARRTHDARRGKAHPSSRTAAPCAPCATQRYRIY